MVPYRNPSPPSSPPKTDTPDVPLESPGVSDSIGNTVFKKLWVLNILLKTLEYVQSRQEDSTSDTGEMKDPLSMEDVMLSGDGQTCSVGNDLSVEEISEVIGGSNVTKGCSTCKEVEQRNCKDIGCHDNCDGNCRRNEDRRSISSGDGIKDSFVEGDGVRSDKCVEAVCEGVVEDGEGCGSGGDSSGEGGMESGLEEELCLLWDASMISDIAEFLHRNQSAEFLLGIASATADLRLKEISIGIVGNMACIPHVCVQFLSDQNMDQVMSFMESNDPKILTETTRLIHVSLSHEETKVMWLEYIKGAPDVFLQFLTFFLKSSTNDDLLRNTASLLDQLLDASEELLVCWTSPSLVEAICEAVEQTCSSSSDVSGSLLLSLQLLTTTNEGIACLHSHWNKVTTLSLCHLCTLDHVDATNYLTALAAVSLLDAIRSHRSQELHMLVEPQRETLLRICAEVCGIGDTGRESQQTLRQVEDLRRTLCALLDLKE